MLTVDSLGKDAGARGLAHTARAAKQVGMRQLLVLDGRLKGVGESLLTHYGGKTRWAVLTRRYYIILAHDMQFFKLLTKIILLPQYHTTSPFFFKK